MSTPELRFVLRRSVWLTALLLVYGLQRAPGAHGFGINLMKVPTENKAQGACILGLLRKYFDSGDGLSGSVLCFNRNYQLHDLQEQLLRGIHSYAEYPWTLLITNFKDSFSSSELLMNEKPQCYFIIVESLDDEDLDEIVEQWKNMLNWNPLAQFVVYLATLEETDEEMTDLMVELLLTFMNKKIFNVNVIGQSEENEFFYGKTVFPYHPDNNCGNRVISVELLDACDYPDEEGRKDEDEDEEADDGDGEDGGSQEDDEGEETGDGQERIDGQEDSDDSKNIGEDDTDKSNEQENNENEDSVKSLENEDNDNGNKINSEENVEEGKENPSNGIKSGENVNEKENSNESIEKEANDNEQDEEAINTVQDQKGSTEEHDQNIGENNEHGDENSENESENIEDLQNKNEEENVNEDYSQNSELIISQPTKEYMQANLNNRNARYSDKSIESVSDVSNDIASDQKESSNENEYDENTERSTKVKLKDELDAQNESSTEIKSEDEPFENSTEIEADQSTESNPDDKNSTEPEVIIEEFFRAKFEDKFPRDLSGCPLTAAFRPWEPYIFRSSEVVATDDYYYGVGEENGYNETSNYGDSEDDAYVDPEAEEPNPTLDTDTASSPKVKLSGIEYQMVKTIAERLHVNIEMQGENSNLYHLFQQLIDGEIEMVVGGIDEDPSISQFVSSSIPYHQDELTWCVAKAQRRYGFFNFVATFNADSGFLIGLFVITCSLVVLVAQRVSRFRLRNLNGYFPICLRVLGILLNQAIAAQDFPLTLRLLFALSFLMGFFFSNTYQSFLISTLTNPRSSHQIQTLEEIYSNRMTVMGTSENVRHLTKEGEIFKYIRERFQMCYNIVDCLNDAAHDEHIAVAISRQHSFYNPRIQRDSLYCFDRRESLYVYQVTMLLPKKYHLLHQINPVIQHIIESGHMQKWARDLDMRRKIHEEITRVREDPFKALTYDQFRGAFVFSFGLLLVATCVFFAEFVYIKCWVTKRKKMVKNKKLNKKLRI